MKTKLLSLTLFVSIFFSALTVARGADAKDEQDMTLRSLGRVLAASLTETYLSLADIEKVLAKDKAGLGANFATHLRVQLNMLKLQETTYGELAIRYSGTNEEAAFTSAKETTAAIIAQNQSVSAYMRGESKNLDVVRGKHKDSRERILSLLGIKDDDKICRKQEEHARVASLPRWKSSSNTSHTSTKLSV